MAGLRDMGVLKVPENISPDKKAAIGEIIERYNARNKEINRQHLGSMGRIALGSLVSGASFHPILNIPYVGTGLGGAMYDAGQAIVEGDKLGDIAKRAGRGFAIGETVGAVPYVGKGVNKLSGGKIGNALDSAAQKVAANPAVQKAYDVLMTDIKAFNPNKQTVYHGSPYDFNKFSNEAIGTGEGAQAHGYGHYTALNKDIAEGYRKRLSAISNNEKIQNKLSSDLKNNRIPQLKDNEEKELFEYIANKIDPSSFNEEHLSNYWFKDLETPEAKDFAKNLLGNLKNNTTQGQTYKLSIPKDDVMLREDLPFSEQPKAVQDALKKLANDYKEIGYGDLLDSIGYDEKGDSFYRLYSRLAGNGENAARELSDRGIKGISYNGGIDGEARVIFNPDDIDIVRKFYNQPEAIDYLNKMKPNSGAIVDAFNDTLNKLSKKEKKQIRNQWRQYAKDNFIGSSVDIPEYTTVYFTNANLGKDFIHNLPEYPNLLNNLQGSKYQFSTNYNNETDRLYDHLTKEDRNRLFDYLIEVVKDEEGKIHHNYKMMKNINRGDKP